MTEKYLLFVGKDFYPDGGWFDFIDHFPDIENAKEYLRRNAKDKGYYWAHIVDLETRKIIWKWDVISLCDGTIIYEI